jgi:hypothetical protein
MIDDSETNISVMEAIGLQGFDKRAKSKKSETEEPESESEQSEKTVPLNEDPFEPDEKLTANPFLKQEKEQERVVPIQQPVFRQTITAHPGNECLRLLLIDTIYKKMDTL